MKGRDTFTISQIEAIKRLISKKVLASEEEQKRIRDEIREIFKFYFSDFSSKKGYTVTDLDDLILLGRIKIVDEKCALTATPIVFNKVNHSIKTSYNGALLIDNIKKSFAPIASNDIEILILGTIPGELSLQTNEYYAHSRNKFWKIIATITGEEVPVIYEQKKSLLKKHKIGLWDVAEKAEREGSLDASIVNEIPNDLESFLGTYKQVKLVGFNGRKAETMYDTFFSRKANINYLSLSSTSPANAAINFETICNRWMQILM